MSGLRIAVDGRSLVGGTARGITHYLARLLEHWPDGDELRVVLPRGGPLHGSPDGWTPVRVPLPGRVVFTAAALAGRPRLDRLAGGCDVTWVPAPAPVAPGDAPVVLTVHDRSWERRPGDFTAYERAWHAAARPRRLARRAARVLTTTRVGRDDLVAAWSLDPARVRAVGLAPAVVPARPDVGATAAGSAADAPTEDAPTAGASTAGPSTAAGEAAGGEAGVPPAAVRPPYRLFVGALEPRKGPDVLADALRRLPAPGRTVVVGGGRLQGLLGAPGVQVAGPIDDAALSALYAAADHLVVPSLLEGFGLPALEALAHGTPVVATDLPEVREVLGDAARYVPPGDAAALAAALADPPIAVPAPPPAATRTWADVARETRAVLAEAAA